MSSFITLFQQHQRANLKKIGLEHMILSLGISAMRQFWHSCANNSLIRRKFTFYEFHTTRSRDLPSLLYLFTSAYLYDFIKVLCYWQLNWKNSVIGNITEWQSLKICSTFFSLYKHNILYFFHCDRYSYFPHLQKSSGSATNILMNTQYWRILSEQMTYNMKYHLCKIYNLHV
jgi:hypothetical protein